MTLALKKITQGCLIFSLNGMDGKDKPEQESEGLISWSVGDVPYLKRAWWLDK